MPRTRVGSRPITLAAAVLISVIALPVPLLAQEAEPGEPTASPQVAPETAKVRFLHGAQAGAMDLYVGDELALQGVEFGQVSDYVDVPAGKQSLETIGAEFGVSVGRAAKGDPNDISGYTDINAKLKPGSANTVVLIADGSGLNELWVVNDKPKPKAGRSAVRIVALCSNCGPVDFAIDKAKKPLVKNLHYLETVESEYVPVKPGSLDLEMRLNGQKKPVADFDPVTLMPGSSTTLYGIGWVVNDTMTLLPALDAALSSVRFMNASRDLVVADVYVDGKNVAKRLFPGQATAKPSSILAGEHLLQVVEAGEKPSEGTLSESLVDFPAGPTAVEVVAGESLEAVAAPAGGASKAKAPRVRFAHIDPEIPAVDIDIKDMEPVLGLAAGESTDYITLPGDSSSLWIRPSDDPTNIYHEMPLDLTSGENYTAYLGGSPEIPSVDFVIVSDPVAKDKKK